MIHTTDLIYTYQGSEPLKFPNLSIRKGEHTLIIGDSGSGKTTLLHLLAGLRKPSSGEVNILNKQISSMSSQHVDRFRGQHMGMIFQVPHFIRSLNVYENITIAQALSGSEINKSLCLEILDQLNIGSKASKMTNELSVGEQQRVAIARALINKPKIVFADEPTSALDDKNTGQVIDLLKEQSNLQGATLIVVTHDQRLKDNFENQIGL